jgi:RNA polymerase sigma-70 factor (ECF subfamily)
MPHDVPSLRPERFLEQAGWVRAVARALVLETHRVDDVVQETWLAALERPTTKVGNVRAWLGGIVRNVVRQESRGAARRAAREAEQRREDPLPSAAELVERADTQKRLVQAILELDEPDRSTVLLRYFEELSSEEIARRLALPASTVRSRLHSALGKLRERLDREHAGERRAWSLALIPLMLPRAKPGVALASSASTGVLAMTIQGSFLAALAVALGFGASYAFRLARPGAGTEPAPAAWSGANATEPAARAGSVPVREAAARASQEAERRPLAPQVGPAAVRGRVLDLQGAPAPGVRVFVGGRPSPLQPVEAGMRLVLGTEEERRPARGEPGEDYREEELEEGLGEWAAIDAQRLEKHGAVLGKTVLTDAQGRFEAPVTARTRVYVTLFPEVGVRKVRNGAWHAAPAEGIELRVRRIPCAELAISLTDLSTGKKLPFVGELHGAEGPLAEWEARDGIVRRKVEVPPEVPNRFRVVVVAPSWARTTHEFSVTPGSENRVEVTVHSGAGLSGEVVDALGLPVPGAFVYWGELLDLRQRSLFRAYEPKRVVGGVRTDAAGRFTLPGTAALVSAWHPEHSPASAAARDAARLVLPPRGAIRGVVLDEQGLPAASQTVTLDRAREILTDALGAFTFEGVEAGVHGLAVPPERFVGVVVAPGETVEVLPEEPIRPSGELKSGGLPLAQPKADGVILGLGRVFGVSEWGHEGGRLEAGWVRPGRHLLMSGSGILSVVDVQPGGPASLELGTARVTIERAAPDDPLVYLLPEEASAHPAARHFARHLFDEREAGRAVFAPLAAGRYVLVVEGREAVLQLEVAEGAELVIERERWMGGAEER